MRMRLSADSSMVCLDQLEHGRALAIAYDAQLGKFKVILQFGKNEILDNLPNDIDLYTDMEKIRRIAGNDIVSSIYTFLEI